MGMTVVVVGGSLFVVGRRALLGVLLLAVLLGLLLEFLLGLFVVLIVGRFVTESTTG